MADMFQDLRFGVRQILKAPGPAAIAVLSLTLGIGANSAIFSLVDAASLRPWPAKNPENLVMIFSTSPQREVDGFSYPDFLDLGDQTTVFDGLLAFGKRGGILSTEGTGQEVTVDVVSPNYFSVLGMQPALGRTFAPQERDDQENSSSIVISYALWQGRFGGDPGIIGKAAALSGKQMTVVGVAPLRFTGLERTEGTDVWISPSGWSYMTGSRPDFAVRANRWLNVVGRVGPGASERELRAQLQTAAARLAAAYPSSNKLRGFDCVTEAERVKRALGTAAFPMVMVGLVLLISCANVAGLQLAQLEKRRQELAMRMSLGAGRTRIIRQLLTEGVLTALLGGALSLLISSWIGKAIPSLIPGATMLESLDIRLDGRVLTVTALASLLTVLLSGVTPAYQASKYDLNSVLKGEDSRAGSLSWRFGLRNSLVVTEIALSMILMAGSALLLRSFWTTLKIRPGFDTQRELLIVGMAPPTFYGQTEQQAREYLRSLAERIRALPGVRHASYARRPQLAGYEGGEMYRVTIPGYRLAPGEENPRIRYNIVSEDYFQTMGTAVLRGRDFTSRDAGASTKILIINDSMARRYWPGEDAVGKWLKIGSDDYQVAGVVEDGKYVDIHEQPQPYMFFPFSQKPSSEVCLLVGTAGDPRTVVSSVLNVARQLDSRVPLTRMTTLDEHMKVVLQTDRLTAELIGVLGILGIFLSGVGLYGLISYLVNRRTQEIGIRMALGARPGNVLRMVLSQGARLILIGLIMGTGVALAAGRVISSMLYGIQPTDALAFAGAAGAVAVLSLVACAIPARRATKVQPVTALRCQ